jgi:Na+/H+ antiporter NhaD/arsenite permease-like protein
MLLLRPFLRANAGREYRKHLAPFFIVCVANAGGLLTPIGDPPLLVGFLQGVPFFWTLRLFPAWLLYVATCALALYWVDRRAYARETVAPRPSRGAAAKSLELRGVTNLALLALVPVAAFLPAGLRELLLLAVTLGAYFAGSRAIRAQNAFSLGPIVEVALVFAGLFACLVPVELGLAERAHALPLTRAWHFFWTSGALSSVLDNAPTYAALTAVARGVSHGHALVAGVDPLLLAAVSTGSVVMGASTYIGNGPNLMVKAIAERAGYELPSFFRYALFTLAVMMPAHLVVTAAFVLLER